jgi:hypothetical protein
VATVHTMTAKRRAIADWLAAHGIDPGPAYAFDVTISGKVDEVVTITVQRYAVNGNGRKYQGADGQPVTDEPITVPLTCWPENV